MGDEHLFERIRAPAVLMAEEAARAFPGDYDAQRAMVVGAGKLAPAMLQHRTEREDHASRPRW